MTKEQLFKAWSFVVIFGLTGWHCTLSAQEPLSLDSCRNMALRNNKSLQIADEVVTQAAYTRKAARGAYLPSIDFTGAYIYNQKDIQLVDVDALRSAIGGLGIPSSWASAIIPDDLLEFDTHHVGVGAVTVTQPVFLGGKIKAINDLASQAEKLAGSQRRLTEENVITSVDDAYWLVVSLEQKKRLAKNFVALVDTLHRNVAAMVADGVATRSDELTVSVALNEAEIALVKVENGLSLSRMLLAQLCGMPLDSDFVLQDVVQTDTATTENTPIPLIDMENVYGKREELKSLGYLTHMAEAQQRMALSTLLPSVAVVGAYTFNKPNLYNGFKTDFDGMFRVGVVLRVPIFHWGTDFYRYKASHSATVITRIETEAAKERIELQVNQAAYRLSEAIKTYHMTCLNTDNASDNLHNAQLSFSEGVYTTSDVLAAQVAWEKAQTEKIDAYISVQISHAAMERALGETQYGENRVKPNKQ